MIPLTTFLIGLGYATPGDISPFHNVIIEVELKMEAGVII